MLVLSILFFMCAVAGLASIPGAEPNYIVGNCLGTLICIALGLLCLKKHKKKKSQKKVTKPQKPIQIKNVKDYRQVAYNTEVQFAPDIEFKPKKKIGISIWFDDEHFALPRLGTEGLVVDKLYNTKDVIGYEVIEDGKTITSGGLGSAVVGGALFGGVGAIVGSNTGKKVSRKVTTSLKLKLTMDSIVSPTLYVDFIKLGKPVNLDRSAEELVQETISVLQVLQHRK